MLFTKDLCLLFCCGCQQIVQPQLVTGKQVYPHRKDLFSLPFWQCVECNNFVGCHHKTVNRTQPLGSIPTSEIKELRQQIHNHMDPLWQDGHYHREQVYAMLSLLVGKPYHTAEINTVSDANAVLTKLDQLYECI